MKPLEWIDTPYFRSVTRYDAFWVFVSCALTVIMMLLFFGTGAFASHIDFDLHPTVISIPGMNIFVNLFLLVNFIVFSIKNRSAIFYTVIGNWILVVSGLLLLVFLDANIGQLKPVTTSGWTIYPPLPDLSPNSNTELLLMFVGTILRILQLIIVIALLLIVYRWGRKAGL